MIHKKRTGWHDTLCGLSRGFGKVAPIETTGKWEPVTCPDCRRIGVEKRLLPKPLKTRD